MAQSIATRILKSLLEIEVSLIAKNVDGAESSIKVQTNISEKPRPKRKLSILYIREWLLIKNSSLRIGSMLARRYYCNLTCGPNTAKFLFILQGELMP